MKSYLSLISISAKVRKRQSRMIILCIIFSVFLITAIFSVADMMIRTESGFMMNKHGNWHFKLQDVSQEVVDEVQKRSDVNTVGVSSVFNFYAEEPYHINEKKAVLYGADEPYIKQIYNGITEGTLPKRDNEVMLSDNAKPALGVKIGDNVKLHTPAGEKNFTVSGFGSDDKSYYGNQTYLVGIYMTQNAFASVMDENNITDIKPAYYFQFQDAKQAAKAMKEIKAQYHLSSKNISENVGVMGTAGESKNKSMQSVYGIAGILFVMVLLAGVFMISGSMNSNISQRTQFFGMMRCIGAGKKQIVRFVRLEALNWCKTAVPIGVILGTVISWCICASLRYGIGGEFETTPVFKISPVGLISGAVIGIVTVLLAARSPAKKASKVSPVSAVSGSSESTSSVRHSMKIRFGKVERSLGINHAAASRKGLCLMTASFALSIILFLSFSVIMDFAQMLVPSQAPTSADMALGGYKNELVLDRSMVSKIKKIKGVENAYGSNYKGDVPVKSSREGIDSVNIVSYDDTLLSYAKGSVIQGDLSEIYGDSNKAATVFNKNNQLKVGDTVEIAGKKVEIACALSQGLFGDNRIVICSQKTYDNLMGKENYGLIGIQFAKDATEQTAAQIRSFENDKVIVTDMRQSNRQDKATYIASRIVCYGFLAIIAIITLFNIINSISMSVSARIKQYGAMRAVGMDNGQINRMISAEAFTYAVSGLIAGFLLGIPISRFLYITLITKHMGIQWHLQISLIIIVFAFVVISALLAVYAPAKRMRNMAITDNINDM